MGAPVVPYSQSPASPAVPPGTACSPPCGCWSRSSRVSAGRERRSRADQRPHVSANDSASSAASWRGTPRRAPTSTASAVYVPSSAPPAVPSSIQAHSDAAIASHARVRCARRVARAPVHGLSPVTAPHTRCTGRAPLRAPHAAHRGFLNTSLGRVLGFGERSC